MTSHDIHTLAGAFALDSLPADEERFFAAHLAACESCRQEVAELRATAATLGSAVAAPPPPSLRSNVLTAIEATRQEPAPMTDRRWAQRRLALVSAAAALVFVAAGIGVVATRLNTSLEQMRETSAQVAVVLTAEDAQTIPVNGKAGQSARLITSDEVGKTVFVGSGLPAVPDDKTLELWLIDDEGAHPAGVFQPDERGQAMHLVDADLKGVEAVGVTIEPAGGSPQPTTDPFLLTEV